MSRPPTGPLAALHTLAGGLPRTFWILWCGLFVNRAGTFVMPFLALYLTQGRGVSVATAGAVVSLYGLGAAVASPLGGWLADHVGRRATMVTALGLGGVGMIALGFARELWVIAPLTFVVSVLGESYRPAMQAAIADLVPPRDRVRAFGILYWVINLGFSAGLLLAGAIASRSFLWLFLGDGITSLLFAFVVWRLVPETRPAPAVHSAPEPSRGFFGSFLAPYRDLPFLWFVLLSVLVLLVFMQHVAALPLEMSSHGISRSWLGFVLALNGIVIVLVQPFLGPWLSRLDRSRVLSAGAVLVGAGFGLTAFAAGPAAFALSVIVWSVGEIFVLPTANAVVADIAPASMRGRYQGAYGLSFGLAAFGAPLIGTAVLQKWGSSALWAGCLVVGLLVAAGQLALSPRLRRLRRERTAS